MVNSCNSKKLGWKNLFLFSQTLWNFCFASAPFYEDWGSTEFLQKVGRFPWNLSTRGRQFSYRDLRLLLSDGGATYAVR